MNRLMKWSKNNFKGEKSNDTLNNMKYEKTLNAFEMKEIVGVYDLIFGSHTYNTEYEYCNKVDITSNNF